MFKENTDGTKFEMPEMRRRDAARRIANRPGASVACLACGYQAELNVDPKAPGFSKMVEQLSLDYVAFSFGNSFATSDTRLARGPSAEKSTSGMSNDRLASLPFSTDINGTRSRNSPFNSGACLAPLNFVRTKSQVFRETCCDSSESVMLPSAGSSEVDESDF